LTPWSALNRVGLLFPGWTAWTNYKYDTVGGYWYKESAPGVPDDPTIQCGMGIALIRGGPADSDDVLVLPKWYTAPPNL